MRQHFERLWYNFKAYFSNQPFKCLRCGRLYENGHSYSYCMARGSRVQRTATWLKIATYNASISSGEEKEKWHKEMEIYSNKLRRLCED